MSALLPSSTLFEQHQIRRLYDDATETWWFSINDIIQALTQQPDYQTARKYWNKLKERLAKEGSQLVTNCHQLKMPADDGKLRETDMATAETLLRLVQSVPSPKAEPIKLWLAKVGYERMQEMADPSLGIDRVRELYRQHGRSEKWIQQRMMVRRPGVSSPTTGRNTGSGKEQNSPSSRISSTRNGVA